MARKTWKRGIGFERQVYQLLVQKFGEMFVHAQKPFNDYKSRVDFFVYGKNQKFGIDVFYADNIHSFQGCINAKQRIYNNANFDVVFLSANLSIDQELIDGLDQNKINKLPPNIKILDLKSFARFIEKLEPL